MESSFISLGIAPKLVSALEAQSILVPTAIQIAAIPALLERKDAFLQSETGTGKTLAYLLPIMTRIDSRVDNPQAIILAPTHELAVQIHNECLDLSRGAGLKLRSLLLIGGTSTARQLEKLKTKPHIVIGSVGRIRDLIEMRKLKTHLVNVIVVDEADRLLTKESFASLQAIISSTPKERNLVFVSATAHQETAKAFKSLSEEMLVIQTSARNVPALIEHQYLVCEERDKPEIVRKLIHSTAPSRSIVFLHRNEDAEILALKLSHHGLRVIDIHGSMDKEERKRSINQIRNGKVDVLIASDVAARGLDIKGITHVINFDAPSSSEAYLHRAGRTGRAGKKGTALSLISSKQLYLIERFEKDLGIIPLEIRLSHGEIHALEKN